MFEFFHLKFLLQPNANIIGMKNKARQFDYMKESKGFEVEVWIEVDIKR